MSDPPRLPKCCNPERRRKKSHSLLAPRLGTVEEKFSDSFFLRSLRLFAAKLGPARFPRSGVGKKQGTHD